MKILILSDNFFPFNKGGASKVALDLAYGLEKAGGQVFVLTTCREKKNEKIINYQGLKVFRIYSNYHERWRAYLSLYNPQTIKKTERIIKEINPDVVHAHNIHYYLSYYSLKIARQYSKAVFLTVHDAMIFNYGKLATQRYLKNLDVRTYWWDHLKQARKRYNPFRNILIRYYLRYVDKIFAVSYALKEALNQNGIKNIEVIYNGIDTDEWRVDNDRINDFKRKYNLFNKKIVLFGGRLSDLKGGEQIMKVMGKVVKRVPEAILLVAGRGDNYVQKILALAKSKDIPLIFAGWLERDELKAAYFSSNIVVTPSLCLDTFNMINLEAMASEKPVVGTCFGGTSEIVKDGVTGYIVNPFNTEKMAGEIIGLLRDHEKAEKFGKAGYQRVKKYFSLDSQIKKTIAWYRKVLGEGKRSLT